LLFGFRRFNLKERGIAVMANGTKFDPFKPSQPSIPGVPAAAVAAEPEPPPEVASDRFELPEATSSPKSIPAGVWVAVGLIIVLGLGGAWFYWDSGPTAKSEPSVAEQAQSSENPAGNTEIEELPVGPGVIGSTSDLPKAWSAKRFLFRSDLSAQEIPSLVVRLPNNQYWGLSMIEPFGSCQLDYVTDLNVLQNDYKFHASHPMIADPCTHAVYDLLQYDGGAPDGGLVRGALVHGAGVRPPMAIEIEVHGNQLRAVRME
jgi:hypothetical protein